MHIQGTPNPLGNFGPQLGGIDPQAIMLLLQLVQALQGMKKQGQGPGAAPGGPAGGGAPFGAPGGGTPQSGGFPAGGSGRGRFQNMSPAQRQQMRQLRCLLGPHFKPLFKQAMCGQLKAPNGRGACGMSPVTAQNGKQACGPNVNGQANVNRQANANNQNGLINVNNQININNQVIQGEEKGGWLAKHGGYKKLKDGSYEITKGKYKGCTAHKLGKGEYAVKDSSGNQKGVFKAPKGKDKIASPLTFDLNGDGKVSTTGVQDGKKIDIDGDGKVDQSAWAGKGDGVLAFDANKDGKVGGDGKELLGNNTDVDGDGKADGHANGFEALKALAQKNLGFESVADGKLDQWELQQLSEKTGLGMLVDGQKKSLGELGISQIDLGYQEAGKNPDANGNEHRQVGAGFVRNGQRGQVNDVWFRYQ